LRIKICGITNEADACLVAELGGDAIGLNFYPPSPRYVATAVAQRIARSLQPFVEPVGLFVSEAPAVMVRTLGSIREIRTIQLHGDRPKLSDLAGWRVIYVFPIAEAGDVADVERCLADDRSTGELPSAVMIDTRVRGQHGGTGRTLPWSLVERFQPGIPIILAGGLTSDNVAEAIRIVRPYAVDVASGVEMAPGKKDPAKLKQFIHNARNAAAKYIG
jgi:phosphoribosylanthranilate isomerase